MRRSILVAIIAVAAAASSSGAAKSTGLRCPLKSGPPSGGDVQWGFHETGAPSAGNSTGVSSSYTHGRGNWTSGRATGTACSQDSGGGQPTRNLVLAVVGPAKLKPRVNRLHHPGVALALRVRVSASDDPACTVGTTGTLTLFASYFATHVDSVELRFGAACSGHDYTFTGSGVVVLIARHGAQVNSA
jgi:hypothetical protein